MEEVGGGDEVVEVPRLGCGVRLVEYEYLREALARLQDLGADPVHRFDLNEVSQPLCEVRLRDCQEAV